MTRLGEATAYGDVEIEMKTISGIDVRLASPRSLYRMKCGTVRPIDHADAAALRAAFDFELEG